MIRWAVAADAPAIEHFLSGYPETSMFLRGNLAAHGIGLSEHPNASNYLIWPAEGAIRAVFGRSNNGYLMVQAPGAPPQAHAEAAAALSGYAMNGLTGDATQTAMLLDALNVGDQLSLNDIEPLYRADLGNLPATPEEARAPEPGDEALLTQWFADYVRDTGMELADPDAAHAEAVARAQRAIGATTTLLLKEEGRPVAMAAVNAQVADIVQIGGVFVPRSERNRGLGRRVTGALMRVVAEAGARTAILFANNPAAARAYEAIGFGRIGEYRVALAARPIVLTGEAS